jgi:signal recognition particle GTPase
MLLFLEPHNFDLDSYLSMLPRWKHRHQARPALALPWVLDGLQDWPSVLAKADRIVGAMTAAEKRNPEEITPENTARIASVSGTAPEEVNGLLSHFFSMKRRVVLIRGLSFWQRLKLITGWGRSPLNPDGVDA